MVRQPIPDAREEDVERIVRRDFPAAQFESAIAILQQYGAKGWERERPRVQLAALKLAGGNLNSLRRHIGAANHDYRDVLTAAEYPEYAKAGVFRVAELPRKEKRRIVQSDWDQYQKWLGH